MKVKELIKELRKHDPEAEVCFDDRNSYDEYGCTGINKVSTVDIFESPEYAGGNETYGGVTLS
jgi:hypothetical protein